MLCGHAAALHIRRCGKTALFTYREQAWQVVVVVVVVVVLTLNRTFKYVVTGQAPVTLELRNTPGKKHKPTVVHAYYTNKNTLQLCDRRFCRNSSLQAVCDAPHISQLTQFMPPPEICKK